MKEAMRAIIIVIVISGGVFILSRFQRSQVHQEAETERTKALERTATIRNPFAQILRLVQSMHPLPEIQSKEFSTPEAPEGVVSPCLVVDLSFTSPEVWLPRCDWPDEIRAKSPEDVETLILLHPMKIEVATYGAEMRRGYRQDYKLWVYLWKTKKLLVQGVLQGGPLPEKITVSKFDFSGKDIVGNPPNLREWLFGSSSKPVTQ